MTGKKLLCALLAAAVLLGAAFAYPHGSAAVGSEFSSALKRSGTGEYYAVTYDRLNMELIRLAEAYPELIRRGTVGTTAMGRNIPLLIMGTGPNEACFAAGIHADEHISTLYLLRCIEDYAAAWASQNGTFGGYDLKALFAEYTLYIVPSCNPDGVEKVVNDAAVRYTSAAFTLEQRRTFRSNAGGVDLNRNFPFCWSQINNGYTSPGIGYYKGPSAGSEPETKALMNLCNAHNFLFLISFHIQGRVIYYRDTENGTVPGDYELAKAISNATASGGSPVLSLASSPTSSVNSYGGGFENWFRYAFKRPGLCIELVSSSLTLKKYESTISNFETTVSYDSVKTVIPEAMCVSLVYGDLDHNGRLSLADVSTLFRWWNGYAALGKGDILQGDHNRDGTTDLRDAASLYRYLQ